MKTIQIKLAENSYPIYIGCEIADQLGSAIKKKIDSLNAIVITNGPVNRLHGKKICQALRKDGFNLEVIEVPDSEKSKSAETVISLVEQIARYDSNKSVFVIAIGGGVIGDLAGFIAAVYKRGVPFVQVPTTLLGQIDSAIGGKTGVDLSVGKNLMGAFHQPKLVWSDIAMLKTLPKKEISTGLAEAVKYGVIWDEKLFSFIEQSREEFFTCDEKAFTRLVTECSKIKAEVVMDDEKEVSGLRCILNFGHTVGHAIESAGQYEVYNHGEAVGLGMRCAMELALRLEMVDEPTSVRVNQLITDVGLPEKIQGVTLPAIMAMMERDKKFKAGKNRFVLATQIGKVKLVEDIAPNTIRLAIRNYFVT